MKKITFLIASLALFSVASLAQTGNRTAEELSNPGKDFGVPITRTCGTMDVNTAAGIQNFEEAIAPQLAAYLQSINNGGNPEAIYNIPTIVHVIHNNGEAIGSGRNISNTKIQQQMTILNDDFRRTNADAVNTPAAFAAVAADCEINFCLVTTYPSGHPQAGNPLPEPGVDRVNAVTAGFGNAPGGGYTTGTIDGTIKPATSWNPNEVMNIWVLQLQNGLLGYATFPNSGPANRDGTVMGYQYFGLTGGPYGLGRTTTHEVGHWLGCYHIWGDDGGACSGSDFCADTPNQGNSTGGCPSGVQTDGCSPSAPGYMYQNYMDYSNDACMNLFTQNQKARMQSTMASQPRRSTLNGFSATLCGTPTLTAEFSGSPTTINAGQTVTFTDASSGPNTITTWNWDFDVANLGGVTPGTASGQGPHVVTYNNAGTYTVSLDVIDNVAANDNETKTAYIIVNPPGTQNCDSSAANWDLVTDGPNTGLYLWSGGNGYIMGHNSYGDNGWADKITYSTPGMELTDVFFYFGAASGTGNMNFKVWGDNAGLPNNSNIMASQTVAISSLAIGGNATLWNLPVPAALSGNFYIGFDHNTLINGDTAALMSAPLSTNSMFANETTGWKNLSSYGVNHGTALIPVICNITTGEKTILGEINQVTVFPNPSAGTINVALTIKAQSKIEVYNIVGELIYSNNQNSQLVSIDMANQPNGVYFVNITTDKTITTKKIVLSK